MYIILHVFLEHQRRNLPRHPVFVAGELPQELVLAWKRGLGGRTNPFDFVATEGVLLPSNPTWHFAA